jgi:hypothetical protein
MAHEGVPRGATIRGVDRSRRSLRCIRAAVAVGEVIPNGSDYMPACVVATDDAVSAQRRLVFTSQFGYSELGGIYALPSCAPQN